MSSNPETVVKVDGGLLKIHVNIKRILKTTGIDPLTGDSLYALESEVCSRYLPMEKAVPIEYTVEKSEKIEEKKGYT